MVRLEDVARAAGVSRATVSNVFNKPDVVRAEVRERVRAAALSLGYNGPDPTARAFRGGKVNSIAFVMGGDGDLVQPFTHPYARDLFSGIAAACDEHGAGLALVSDLGRGAFWGIRNAIADGFILQSSRDPTHIEAARNRRLPFVALDEDPGPDVSSVQIDDRDGARQAAEHLVALGHRRFAIMTVLRDDRAVMRVRGSDPVYHPPARHARTLVKPSPVEHQRLAGYSDALAEAGISVNSVPIVEAVTSSTPAAMSGAALLLDSAPDATAILTMSDVQALAILAEARKRKIRVPQDLSVVGFDDNPEAATSDPPLTTVAQPVKEKGRAAAQVLFEDGGPQKIVLPVKLVLRASTAPPVAVVGRKRAPPAQRTPRPAARTISMVLGGELGIVQTFMNPYARDLMAGIAEVCDEHGARLAILSELDPTDVGQSLADGYIVQQRAALSRFPATIDGPRQVVLLDDDAGGAASSVRIDDRDGARQAAEHLIRLGHRRFAIAAQSKRQKQGPTDPAQPTGRNTGPASGAGFQIDVAASYLTADPVYRAPTVGALTMEGRTPVQVARLAGFADALSTAGIEINRVPMVEMRSYTVASAMSGAALLLDRAPDATAILTMADVQALAIVAEAKRRGIRVPEDLSVVGYDDDPEAAASDPPLTTVVQPIREKGRTAARILFEGVENVVLPVDLVVRGSTALPKG